MVRVFGLLLIGSLCGPAQAPTATPEVERLDSLIEELGALKMQVSQAETRIDALLRSLSEQRGALVAKPPVFNALKVAADLGEAPEARLPMVRCKALTSSGKRCTRAVMEGQKYCRQHALARQK